MTTPEHDDPSYSVYTVLADGETRYMAAKLQEASAQLYFWGDEDWCHSGHQTASARHCADQAACLLFGDDAEIV